MSHLKLIPQELNVRLRRYAQLSLSKMVLLARFVKSIALKEITLLPARPPAVCGSATEKNHSASRGAPKACSAAIKKNHAATRVCQIDQPIHGIPAVVHNSDNIFWCAGTGPVDLFHV